MTLSNDRLLELVSVLRVRYASDGTVRDVCDAIIDRFSRNGRPTLDQAIEASIMCGVSRDEAEEWWLAREAADWMRGTMGGGSLPVGKNWQADMKTFTISVKRQNGHNGHSNGNGSIQHARPKTETVWHMKQALTAVDEALSALEEKAMYDGWNAKRKEEKLKLRERKADLKRKISGLED